MNSADGSMVDLQIDNAGMKKTGGQSITLAAILVMAGLLLSKITGQIREIMIVYSFGYGFISDAFVIGFQIPDLFYQLLIGGAIQAAITPTLAAALEKRQAKASWRSVSIFINIAALVMLAAVLAGELLAPVIIPLYNKSKDLASAGQDAVKVTELAVQVSRALFPQAFFMMMAALCIGILNAYRKFSSTAFGPAIYNIFVILAMALLGSRSPAGAVNAASGVMLAASLFFIFQLLLARREFRSYTLSFDTHDAGFRRLLALALPTMISGSIVQINAIILTSFADQFAGATTSLRNATTTWQLPYGIFAVAIGNVMLPSLAGIHARKDHKAGRSLLVKSLRSALFLTIPSAALFLAMRQDVIRAIFQWGAPYADQTVAVTASILKWYCGAIIAHTLIFIINQAFYARHQTRIALLNGVATLILNGLLCLLFTRVFRMGVDSLSLAYLLTSLFSAAFLYFLYKHMFPKDSPKRFWTFWLRACACAAALLGVVLLLGLLPVHPGSKLLQLLWLTARSVAGIAAYLAAARLIGMPEARATLDKLGKAAKKAAALFNKCTWIFRRSRK